MMKSIKEKTEEYVLGFHSSIQRMCKESYIDGANYVLEHLSMTISVSEDCYLRDNLKKMVEQLKK